MRHPDSSSLVDHLRTLADSLNAALKDMAALGLDDVLCRQVPDATIELDALAQATAAATGTILDECEKLEAALAGTSCSLAVSAMATRIYEACSFQDIVGQRLTKVGRTLQAIEANTAEILRMFALVAAEMPSPPKGLGLEGPQLNGAGLDQGAVDALLGGVR